MKLAFLASFAIPLAFALSSAAAQAPSSSSTVPGGKFGFVHTERILRDSAPAVRAQKQIEGEFQKRDRELAGIADQLKRMQEDLEKNAITLGETQRRAKEREFREDLNQRRNTELAQVVEQANRIIRQIAEQEKFDIIFQEMPAYVSPRIDITDRVIKALEGKSPAK